MDANFWNQRYAEEGFAYGTAPNDFLKEKVHLLKPGSRVLCLGEGEGRNALFLAELGHHVTALDYSEVALAKVAQLASEKKLHVTTVHADLANYVPTAHSWDAIILMWVHLPPTIREKIHGSLHQALVAGGCVLLEAYEKRQLELKTGGPANVDLLMNEEILRLDFSLFHDCSIEVKTRLVSEGKYHQGNSWVVQLVAHK